MEPFQSITGRCGVWICGDALGAHHGHTLDDIKWNWRCAQHPVFEKVQKTVITGPFKIETSVVSKS